MVATFGSRVLIADSDASIRQLLFSRLLDLDIFSDCVSKGTDALKKLAEAAYTVAIIDVGLQGADVVQVLRKIEDLAPSKRPVVLILAEHPEAAKTLDVEIVQIILRKPVDIQQLAELVQSCIRTAERRGVAAVVTPLASGDQLTP